ncbi:MAG: hypothetical protein U0793_04285 [Gemmataceae bacterium]
MFFSRIPALCVLVALSGHAAAQADKAFIKFKDGVPDYGRSLEEMHKTLGELAKEGESEAEKALARLKAYRYLCRLPYADLALDAEYTKYALAASKICKELGRLDHRPKNPGWPEEEFKLALKGTSSSSLSFGERNLSQALDGWMDDSDKFNIEHLGHRRWCINPLMTKTGFGRTGNFSAMYTFDMSRGKSPDFSYVAYPPAGYVPVKLFGKRHAWSISVNPAKFQPPDKETKASICRLDDEGAKKEKLELDFTSLSTIPFGIPNCLVFRPAKLDMAPGTRYLVEIEGVRPRGKGETTLRYVVEFAK